MSCDWFEQYLFKEQALILEQSNPCKTDSAQFLSFSSAQQRNLNTCSFVQQSCNRNYIQSQQRKIEKGDTHNFLINLKPKIKKFLDRFPECLGNIYYSDWRKKTRKSTSIQEIQTLFLEEELAFAFQAMFASRYLNREVTMMRLKDCSQKKACLKALQTLQKGFKKRSFTHFW